MLNFSVGNYGVDQSLLRLKREYAKNKTKIVILAVVPETISRIQSMWKHYSEYGNTFGFKPRFVIVDDKLTLLKNPIDSIITQSVKDMKSIPNIKAIEKPVNQKLITKVQSYDSPKIDIKMPKNIMPKVEAKAKEKIKKVTVVEDVKQPVFSFDRIKKQKRKKKRKPRKITFTVKKTKKNTCDRFKKMKSEVQTKKTDDMVKELKEKGISISGKSNKLLKDVYMCVVNDNMNIKKE